MRAINIFTGAMALGFVLFVDGGPAVAAGKNVASGKTQVVAKIGSREVTLSELRVEMSRLGLSPNAPASERTALDSLINRLALAGAARAGEMHRRPEAILRMHAAQDEALASLYLGVATQPPEPLRRDIDAYIVENSALFAERKIYDFEVLSLRTDVFIEDRDTALFDDAADFSQYSEALENAGVDYSISLLTQSSTSFPKAVRDQLQKYSVNDNIVLKGDDKTSILKVKSIRADISPKEQWAPTARQILLETAARKRADDVVARLRKEAGVKYFRSSAAPPKKTAGNEGG